MTWATKQDHNNVHTLALVVVWKGSEGGIHGAALGTVLGVAQNAGSNTPSATAGSI